MADRSSDGLPRPLPDGVVPESVVLRTEKTWALTMVAMLGIMLLVVVVTGLTGALHPAANVEVIDARTLHLAGEFVESNLGTAREPDGSATVRIVAVQYDFVPNCVEVPVDTPVKFRLTSADAIHGFLLPGTNVNTMVVPGFVAEVNTRFARTGEFLMPCNEFCGLGHHGMLARVRVVPAAQFSGQGDLERSSCAR